MDVRFCEAGTTAARHICELEIWNIRFCALLRSAPREKCVFLLTSTYMEVGHPSIGTGGFAGGGPSDE